MKMRLYKALRSLVIFHSSYFLLRNVFLQCFVSRAIQKHTNPLKRCVSNPHSLAFIPFKNKDGPAVNKVYCVDVCEMAMIDFLDLIY